MKSLRPNQTVSQPARSLRNVVYGNLRPQREEGGGCIAQAFPAQVIELVAPGEIKLEIAAILSPCRFREPSPQDVNYRLRHLGRPGNMHRHQRGVVFQSIQRAGQVALESPACSCKVG